MFIGKLYYDYKDRGDYSISNNGEGIYQYDNNIQFQNSRYILTEALFSKKAKYLSPNSPEADFLSRIADNQVAWLTGMNGVQEGVGLNAPVRSYSFIFGIASQINPTQFHSRYLINSGYSENTSGEIVGIRGSAKQFYNGTDYVYLDGKYTILGKELGSSGNGYKGENKTELWKLNQTFENGNHYIPGWINGAFDTNKGGEDDTIYNYDDTVNTYEFTESTNEMVATAVELFSYLDANHNNLSSIIPPILLPTNETNNQTNATNNTRNNFTLSVFSIPSGATIKINNSNKGITPKNISLESGTYNVTLEKENYSSNSEIINLDSNKTINLTLNESTKNQTNEANITVFVNSSVQNANVSIDKVFSGLTPLTINLTKGFHNFTITKENYSTNYTYQNITQNPNVFVKISSLENNSTGTNNTNNTNNSTSPPQTSDSSSGSSGGGSSDKVDLVYVILEKDLLSVNESQTITLDAKGSRGVKKATAIFLSPQGNYFNLTLNLVSGSEDYGTWEGKIVPKSPGLYKLVYVDLSGLTIHSFERFDIENRSFYATSEEVSDSEELQLIYTAIDKSKVTKIQNVSVTLDARDFQGVEEVTGKVEKLRGQKSLDNFTIDFSLISGNKKYGTWESKIEVNEGDVTYNLKEITLRNKDNETTYEINGRSLYATSAIPVNTYESQEEKGPFSFITGLSILKGNTNNASFPALLGASIFVLVVILSLTIKSIKDFFKKNKQKEF